MFVALAVTATLVSLNGGEASAQKMTEARAKATVDPGGFPQQLQLRYKMQVQGYIQQGVGLRLTYVDFNGPAARGIFRSGPAIGRRARLEAGDVIVDINGRPINNEFDYYRAMNRSNGYARLLVRDIRGGHVRVDVRPRPVFAPNPF